MDRIQVITHQGRRVVLADCSNCPPDELSKIADELPSVLSKEEKGSVLLLADFSQTHVTRENMERVKIAAVFNRLYLKRSAWVVNGNMPRAIHDVIEKFSTRDIPIFPTRDEALEFLVKD